MKAHLGIFAYLAITMLVSCERRPLWDETADSCSIQIKVDWSGSRWEDFDDGDTPTGMSVFAYEKGGRRSPVCIATNNINQVEITLQPGEWQAFVFNQSIPEYASLKFGGVDRYETAKVETVPQQARWFATTRSAVSTEVTKQPVWLASDHLEGLVIEEGKEQSGFVPHSRFADGTFRPLSAIQKCEVKIRFKGVKNLYSVRAVISGVASEWSISEGVATDKTTAHELTGWRAEKEDDIYGYALATFQTFGAPKGFRHTPEELYLHIDALLIDGQTMKSCDIPVGDRLRKATDQEFDLQIDVAQDEPVELPDVEPANEGNGFNVSVEDWGEEKNIDIDI